MRRRLPALIVTVAAGWALLAAPAASAAPTYHHRQDIEIACGSGVLHQDSEWFLPAGQPKALLWLQHGFARTDRNVAELAESFAEAGYAVFTPSLPFFDLDGCTLQNLTGNRPFLDNVTALFGEADDPSGTLARSLAEAARASGHAPIVMPDRMVFAGHSAGAEAVTYAADRLRRAYPAAWPGLRGLILLDPVTSFLDNNTDPSLRDLDPTDLPIRAISATPSLCNNFGSGTTSMRTYLHRPYLGVRLKSGVHTDAEGNSSDTLGTLLCGVPESRNIADLDALAIGWADDYVSGETTARFYPNTEFSDVAAVAGAQILRPF